MSDDLPTVRLRPRKGRRYLDGYPWLYDDELVLDRRTKALAPGTVARLETAERGGAGVVALNPASGIAARELTRDETLGADWLGERLARALALRERLYDAPFYRLCNAEGDRLPGLVVDRFGDVLAVQPNTAWAEGALPAILDALRALLSPRSIVVNRDARGRGQEGMETGGREVVGEPLDAPIPVPRAGATLMADLLGGQKTGLYFDQAENHAFAARLAKGRTLLDAYAHVGGFALAALAAGAEAAVALDSSEPALAMAEQGADASGVAKRFEARKGDAVKAMQAMAEAGEAFDVVVTDPPAFAPSKASLDAGLRAYARTARAAVPLVAQRGVLVACSCSHAVTAEALREVTASALARAGRHGRLMRVGRAGPDHPTHPALSEGGYLKALFVALD